MKLFIGHFGDKKKNECFFAWAEDEDEAVLTVDSMFGEPIFMEELGNPSPGIICFNPVDISENGEDPFFVLKVIPNEFRFLKEDYINQVIKDEKSYSIDVDMKRIERSNEELRK